MKPLLLERFLDKIDFPNSDDGCWQWNSTMSLGYGQVKRPKTRQWVSAHRYAHEQWVGPIPKGLVIDHLCHNPGCVNPNHLEAVTHQENLRRGRPGGERRRYNLCPQGHPYDEANTYHHPNGLRRCRICINRYQRSYRIKRGHARA